MDFHDTLSALLPPARDDEPPTLRRDILDELGDHLACAYNREILRGASSQVARQRVLERFGDPAAVARRLWFDAMKGRIMAQRVLIATCLVVILACTATVGLAWHWMNHERRIRDRAAIEAIELNRRMSDALAQSQAANQQILTQMREMTEAVLHPVSTEWNPVVFKLVEEKVGGPPAAGFSLALARTVGNFGGADVGAFEPTFNDLITLSPNVSARRQLRLVLPPAILAQGTVGQPAGRGGMGGMGGGMGGMGGMGAGMGGMGGGIAMARAIYRNSDSSGIADFGAVQPGDYRFQITKWWDTSYFSTTGQLNVAPGSKVEKLIVCPKTAPDRVQVRVRWSWPADLEREQLTIQAPFTFRYRKLESGLSWVLGDSPWPRPPRQKVIPQWMMNQPQSGAAVRSLLCGPGTMLADIVDRRGLFFWTICKFDSERGFVTEPNQNVWADIMAEDLREVKPPTETPEPHELKWGAGIYGLDGLIVLRPTRSPDVEVGRKHFEVLVGSSVYGGGPPVQIRGDALRLGEGFQDRGGPPTRKDLKKATSRFGGPGIGGMGGGMAGRGNNNNEGWLAWQEAARSVELPVQFWDKVDLGFEAQLGQVNDWTIPLPEELIKAVREALKVDLAPKSKPVEPTAPINR
jgi:hypothetical protein